MMTFVCGDHGYAGPSDQANILGGTSRMGKACIHPSRKRKRKNFPLTRGASNSTSTTTTKTSKTSPYSSVTDGGERCKRIIELGYDDGDAGDKNDDDEDDDDNGDDDNDGANGDEDDDHDGDKVDDDEYHACEDGDADNDDNGDDDHDGDIGKDDYNDDVVDEDDDGGDYDDKAINLEDNHIDDHVGNIFDDKIDIGNLDDSNEEDYGAYFDDVVDSDDDDDGNYHDGNYGDGKSNDDEDNDIDNLSDDNIKNSLLVVKTKSGFRIVTDLAAVYKYCDTLTMLLFSPFLRVITDYFNTSTERQIKNLILDVSLDKFFHVNSEALYQCSIYHDCEYDTKTELQQQSSNKTLYAESTTLKPPSSGQIPLRPDVMLSAIVFYCLLWLNVTDQQSIWLFCLFFFFAFLSNGFTSYFLREKNTFVMTP